MKILLINGSPHKSGTTNAALTELAKTLTAEGAECEIMQVGHLAIRGCTACLGCRTNGKCVIDDAVNEAAEKYAPHILERLGGKTSSEWLFPKVMEVLEKAPDVYDETAYFIDGGDFISWMLTGRQTRSYVLASYKALYLHDFGYPPKEMLRALSPKLESTWKITLPPSTPTSI